MESTGSVSIITDLAELAGLEGEWNALADREANPFARLDWYMAAIRAFHRHQPWQAICLREKGDLAAACVIVEERRAPVRGHEIAGIRRLGEWGGVPHTSPEALGALLRQFAATGHATVLGRLPAESLPIGSFQGCKQGPAWYLWRNAPGAFRLPISGPWDTYFQSLPASRRKQLRRKQRQAEALGEVTFRILTPDAKSFASTFREFLGVEHANPKGDDGRSLKANPEVLNFFEILGQAYAASGELRYFFLDIAGRPAAAQMALAYKGSLWGLKIGYDQEFAKCSPGLLLDQRVMEHSFAEGYGAYEFLGNADPWERFWNPETRRFRSLHIYPLTGAGLITLAWNAANSLFWRIGPSKREDAGQVVLRKVGKRR